MPTIQGAGDNQAPPADRSTTLKPLVVGATPDGKLLIALDSSQVAETNRLLRILIAVIGEGLGVDTEQYEVDPDTGG